MGDENNTQEENQSSNPEPQAQEQQPEAQAGQAVAATESDPEPKHGPDSTVNRVKHMRDVAKLQEQLDAKDAELEGYKGLKDEFEQWKAEQKAKEVGSALKAAGCHDVVAARARLDEFEGDIAKLKEAAPYLFTSSDNSKSTGGNPKGQASGGDIDAKLDKAFGL